MPEKRNLTKRTIAALKPGASQRTVFDEKVNGLCILIYPTGNKTWFVYRRVNGTPVRTKIGNVADVTPENARREAQKINGMIANGINPNDQKQAERREWTLGQLFDYYIEHHAKPHKRPRSVEDDERNFGNHLARWKGRKLSSISRADVVSLHGKIGRDKGKVIANRVLALLSTIYSIGQSKAGIDIDNPAKGVQRFREQSRERFLNGDELRRLFQAIKADHDQDAHDLIMLALLTGVRRSNLLSMAWDNIDLKARVWAIPETKGDPVRVVLVDEAVSILHSRKAMTGRSKWVFPSELSKTGHLQEPKRKAWDRIREAAGVEDVTFHDMRRTVGSWMTMAGSSQTIVGKALGHRAGSKATAIYSRLDLDPVRVALDTATKAMLTEAMHDDDKAVAGKIGKAG